MTTIVQYKPCPLLIFDAFCNVGAINFPSISAADIQKSTRFHPLLYLIAVVQVIWFIVQCISRLAAGLLITQLEVITLTIVLMNGFILLFTWHKPIDPQHPIRIDALNDSYLTQEHQVHRRITDDYQREVGLTRELRRIFNDERQHQMSHSPAFKRLILRTIGLLLFKPVDTVFRDFGRLAINMQSAIVEEGALKVPLFYSPDSTDFLQFTFPAAVLLGIGVNVILCLFWSWGYFPYHSTRAIWRMCAVISGGFCILSLLLILFITFTQLWNHLAFNAFADIMGDFFIYLGIFLFLISFMPFVCARIVLIIDALICVKSLPDSGMQVLPWTKYIPHFS